MRFTRLFLFLGCFVTFGALAVLSPLAGTFGYYDNGPRFAFAPVFDPVDELQLQAAIAKEEAAAGDDERLKLLRDAEIRVALEDYRRLHSELG